MPSVLAHLPYVTINSATISDVMGQLLLQVMMSNHYLEFTCAVPFKGYLFVGRVAQKFSNLLILMRELT